MKTFRTLSVLFLVSFAGCAGDGVAGETYADVSKDASKAFAWFDGLGFPDVKGCRYVRVGTGEWSQEGGKSPENHYIDAFLLEEGTNRTFTVLTLDLSTRTFKQTGKDTGVHERVFFEVLDLEKEARTSLQRLKNPPRGEAEPFRRFGRSLGERAEVFVLAWGCARNGHHAVADGLYRHASTMRSPRSRSEDRLPTGDFIAGLEQDVGHAMMWRAIVAFGDPSISREGLLVQFERVARNYPSSEHVERAKYTAEMLRLMIREDKEHSARVAGMSGAMTPGERAAELIFRLRDQNGRQWSQPGSCDIFSNSEDVTNTPAHQLVAMGLDAVPKLIEALGDDHFTRSVGFHRSFYFSHYVLRVGDCANLILQRIAGREFYERRTTSGYMTKDGEVQPTKAQVEKWWAEVREKGEKRVLVEGTERGDRDAISQALILLQKYPDAALDAIAKGMRNAGDEWPRNALLGIAGEIKGDAVTALLLAEMNGASSVATRVVAAKVLHRRGHKDAVPAMVAQWQKMRQGERLAGGGDVAGFLAGSGDPDAILALGKNLNDLPVARQIDVMSTLGYVGGDSLSESNGAREAANPGASRRSAAEESRNAAESVLVSALQNTDVQMGFSGNWGDKAFANPRVCDIAGHLLNRMRKEKYDFDLAASVRKRDIQRYACLNTWRREHGMPVLDTPRAVPPKCADPDITAPIMEKIRSAKAPGDAGEEIRKLESLGLPAVRAAIEALGNMGKNHPMRGQMESLVQRLSSVVSVTEVEDGSLEPSQTFSGMLRDMKGRPFTVEGFVALLCHIARGEEDAATGVKLAVLRDDDLAGVTLRVRLLSHKVRQGGSQKDWSTSTMVKVGNEVVLCSSGGISLDGAKKRDGYEDIEKAIGKALASGAEVPFEVTVQLVQEE